MERVWENIQASLALIPTLDGGGGGEILVEPQGVRKLCLLSQVAGPEMGEKSL